MLGGQTSIGPRVIPGRELRGPEEKGYPFPVVLGVPSSEQDSQLPRQGHLDLEQFGAVEAPLGLEVPSCGLGDWVSVLSVVGNLGQAQTSACVLPRAGPAISLSQ